MSKFAQPGGKNHEIKAIDLSMAFFSNKILHYTGSKARLRNSRTVFEKLRIDITNLLKNCE